MTNTKIKNTMKPIVLHIGEKLEGCNPDILRFECTCDEPHTLGEWMEYADGLPNCRVTLLVDGYRAYDICLGRVEFISYKTDFVCEIYEQRDSWGQLTLCLRNANPEQGEFVTLNIPNPR